jgi:membrane protein DedA with SNARE-associated domain
LAQLQWGSIWIYSGAVFGFTVGQYLDLQWGSIWIYSGAVFGFTVGQYFDLQTPASEKKLLKF